VAPSTLPLPEIGLVQALRPIHTLVLAFATALAGSAGGARAQTSETPAPLVVTGSVRDGSTRRAVPQARVWLMTGGSAEARIVWSGITDEEGWFASAPVPARPLDIHVEAFGFRRAVGPLEVGEGADVHVSVDLAPAPLEMEPLVVSSVRHSRLAMSGFYERRRRGMGYFLTREEFEGRAVARPSDLFRMIPGVQIDAGRRGGEGYLRFRGCRPDLVLDGVPLVGPTSVDDILHVADIEAVEVQSGAYLQTRPAASPCGTVTIWTREGRRDETGRPMTWRRWLAVGGFVAFVLVMTR